MLYNIPAASGTRMTVERIAELAEIPGVGYIKDSSADAVLLTQLLQEFRDRLGIFNGADTLSFCALAAGARGTVWGAANFIPELTVDLYRYLVVDKDSRRGAGGLGQDLAHLPHPGEHELRQRGQNRLRLGRVPGRADTGPVRLLDEGGRKQLAVALANAGVSG